jgi:hypothetical protein
MKIIFIADFFADEIPGGGELNNEEVIFLLKETNDVLKVKSSAVSLEFLKENQNSRFIISNFMHLQPENKAFLEKKCNYIIYEHDHKYLTNRNPVRFKNFQAPKDAVINFDFYKNAKAILCQSKFHTNIVKKNLELDNIINLGGNLWDLKSLGKMKEFAKKNKKEACSIMGSPIQHKNTFGAIKYCKKEKKPFELVNPCPYYEFLDKISNNDTLVFFPQTPETLSRIVVEARMMNMRVITNNLVGATSEPWFELKGETLINFFENKRKEIFEIVRETLK